MKLKIEFRKKDHELFLAFWKKFEQKIDKLKNVTIGNSDNSIVLSFETFAATSKITLRIIKIWLADAVVLYYKEKYFQTNLVLPSIDGIPNDIVVKALSVFDKATDAQFTLQKIKDLKNINIHSLYIFRLGELRLRWQEVCDLFLRSLPALASAEVMWELMKYLIMVTESRVKEANLFMDGEFVFIKDRLDNDLVEPIVASTTTGCFKVVFELISLAPQNIKVRFNEVHNPELVGFISNLFTNKVVYCT